MDRTKSGYRLPTEAEWEKAARGTDELNESLNHQRIFPWGDSLDNCCANYFRSGDPFDTGNRPHTTPVGYSNGHRYGGFETKDNSSPYGAYDMAGNASEWCNDWYSGSYYSISPYANPTGPDSAEYDLKVLRGGSCYGLESESFLPSDRRNYFYPYPHSYSIGFVGFRLAQTAIVGAIEEDAEGNELPHEFKLHPNYPNPFNPSTTIRFDMPHAGTVRLAVYNILGQRVAELVNDYLPAGNHARIWDASAFASGIYLVRLESENFSKTLKIALVK